MLSQVEVAKHPLNMNGDRILDVRAGDSSKTVSGGRVMEVLILQAVKVHAVHV